MDHRLRSASLALGMLFEIFAWSSGAQQDKRPFTVADDIGFRYVGGHPVDEGGTIQFSPDGKYVAVITEYGDLELNRPAATIRIYRVAKIMRFLVPNQIPQSATPVWEFSLAGDKEGQVIRDLRWVSDSSGIAFLQRVAGGNQQLVAANLHRKSLETLVPASKNVLDFDIAGWNRYVYVSSEVIGQERFEKQEHAEAESASFVGTNRSLWDLAMSDAPSVARQHEKRKNRLRVVFGRQDREFIGRNGEAISTENFALAPDGKSIVTIMPVAEVSSSWTTLYPPPPAPFGDSAAGIRPGHKTAHQFVVVNLESGKVAPLVNAPIADDAGWDWSFGVGGGGKWSADGKAILLAGTFLDGSKVPSRPCIAVYYIASGKSECVEELKAESRLGEAIENGFHRVLDTWFGGGDLHRVKVSYYRDEDYRRAEYAKRDDGWQLISDQGEQVEAEYENLRVYVDQSANKRPTLVASDMSRNSSRVLWDPNEELKGVDLRGADVYTWKDSLEHQWQAGLYLPANYRSGRLYPLLIQNHGFEKFAFHPNGAFATADAATELAAQGFVVLQVGAGGANCHFETDKEIPCFVEGYQAGARQLAADGLVDPQRIGMIGFSRTCAYTMKSIVTESFHLKAASITDGVMADYWQFATLEGRGDAVALIGAKPLGDGLQAWVRNSPAFNLDKSHAALMVVNEGRTNLLGMWLPYAVSRYLHKPVDLEILNTDEHVLTNPAVRYASQQGSVDWFRFWLQGYEDPDPSKADQYVRWRGLKKMQDENDAKERASKN